MFGHSTCLSRATCLPVFPVSFWPSRLFALTAAPPFPSRPVCPVRPPDQRAFLITLTRAGEDNARFRLTDLESTLNSFASADYDLQVGWGGGVRCWRLAVSGWRFYVRMCAYTTGGGVAFPLAVQPCWCTACFSVVADYDLQVRSGGGARCGRLRVRVWVALLVRLPRQALLSWQSVCCCIAGYDLQVRRLLAGTKGDQDPHVPSIYRSLGRSQSVDRYR